MKGVGGLGRILCTKTWNEFKKLAVALRPKSVTFFLQRAPLSKPPVALRILFTSENVLYVFLDSAKGDAFRQTKIPIKRREKQRFVLLRGSLLEEIAISRARPIPFPSQIVKGLKASQKRPLSKLKEKASITLIVNRNVKRSKVELLWKHVLRKYVGNTEMLSVKRATSTFCH